MYRGLFVVLGFAWTSVAIIGAQNPGGNPEAAALKSPVASSPASIKAGEETYQLNCQFCHGPKGMGDGSLAPPDTPSLVDGEWKHGASEGEMFTVIKDGVGPAFTMPPHGDRLSDEDIWNAVNYVRSLGTGGGSGQP